MTSKIMLILLCGTFAAAQGELLVNGDFAQGIEGWSRHATPGAQFEPAAEAGAGAAKITVSDPEQVGYPQLFQKFPIESGTLLEGRVEAFSQNVDRGYGVYAAIDFYDEAGKRISYSQSDAAVPGDTWVVLKIRATAPPATATARLALLLNGTGAGVFRNASVIATPPAPVQPLQGPVAITVTDTKACENFLGFGAEDDGWFNAPVNAQNGVDEEDTRLREERITWMDPDWQRMFFWCQDWNPAGDWETFDFDNPNMQSHYRALDLYQRIGAVVNVVGVEWGRPDAYKDVEKVARAVGTLMEYLIRTKGYTCVQEWTLTNEPNGRLSHIGLTFDDFVRLHVLVKEEFAKRNLKVRITGSDDTNGFSFFSACANDKAYFDTADIFASHRYMPFADRGMMQHFIDDRMSLLETKTPKKPLIIAEFGFHDTRSGALENPVMETYPYAIWTQAFAIDALNRGVSAFSIWCMHEMHYAAGGFMNYGLWNFKNRGWEVRPVYHSWASFCRLTEPGDIVYRCESSSPVHVNAACVGKTLFWVNQSDQPADVVVKNMSLSKVRIMTETNISGDRETGELVTPTENRFTAPPQSFGYVQ